MNTDDVVYLHWSQAGKTSTNCDTSETHLSNWRVNDTLLAELVKKTLGDLQII